MSDKDWNEPGRYIDEAGGIRYQWPPEGRFVDLWKRFDDAFSDEEKHDLMSLIGMWRDEHSTLVSFSTPDGDWIHVEDGINEAEEFLKRNDD